MAAAATITVTTENYFVDPRNFTADRLIRRDSSCLFPAAFAIALARSMHLVSKSQSERTSA